MRKPAVLIVDDEVEMCSSLEEIFRDEGFLACSTSAPSTVLSLLDTRPVDLVLMDVRMPEIGGVDLLRQVKDRHPQLPVIMITGFPSVETAVRAMKHGAVNYYRKPLDLPALVGEATKLLSGPAPGESQAGTVGLVGEHASMRAVRETIPRAADVDAPVLITGESGTGKELVAAAIHAAGRRSKKPFVRVNSAAIPDTLIESELFGHEAGAFTDAKSSRKGRFELANEGTLFLDEIGDMSLSTQARILHALQEQTFERVGGTRSIRTDTRFIAATHRDLRGMTRSGAFREDLYYRLAVITIHVPPLRERGDDVQLLVDYYLERFRRKYDRQVCAIDPQVRDFFSRHTWPGNVRELRNCIERAVIFAAGESISFDDLPAQYADIIAAEPSFGSESRLDRVSKEIIRDALTKSGGVKAKAADMLSISRKTLYNRMKRLGME